MMEQVKADIDMLHADVHALKSSLYRADQVQAERAVRQGLPVLANISLTAFLALFFLLI